MWTKVVKTENNTKRIVPFFTIGTYSASDKDGITLARMKDMCGKGYTVVVVYGLTGSALTLAGSTLIWNGVVGSPAEL